MHFEVEVGGTTPAGRVFLTWAPRAMRIRVASAGAEDVPVTLRSRGPVGHVEFRRSRGDTAVETLPLTLPASGSWVEAWVAGRFGAPSASYGDAGIEVVGAAGMPVAELPLMVRIRKHAETLTSSERDRLVSAFAALNANGSGRFTDFRDMHTGTALREAHGDHGFLPWHRAYLLDLERELQAEDDIVALPYWRFDQPAPSLFSVRFMGRADRRGRVRFSPGHPLRAWRTDGSPGIVRRMRFSSSEAPPRPRSEARTLMLGGEPVRYASFASMERNPHDLAHLSFRGYISNTRTAPRDPLFFLLHANVDRLWAKWQWYHETMRPNATGAFSDGSRVGHRMADTMWPWNGVTGGGRPSTAPGGGLAPSASTDAPGVSPRVADMIDYQGLSAGTPLGFDYDDVPYEA